MPLLTKTLFAILMLIVNMSYIGIVLAISNNYHNDKLGGKNPRKGFFTVTLKVPDLKPPNGRYVKFSLNGKSLPGWPPLILCASNDSEMTQYSDNMAIKKAILEKALKWENNDFTVTQCYDPSCERSGQEHHFKFSLKMTVHPRKEGVESIFIANPNSKKITLKKIGPVCTVIHVNPGMGIHYNITTPR